MFRCIYNATISLRPINDKMLFLFHKKLLSIQSYSRMFEKLHDVQLTHLTAKCQGLKQVSTAHNITMQCSVRLEPLSNTYSFIRHFYRAPFLTCTHVLLSRLISFLCFVTHVASTFQLTVCDWSCTRQVIHTCPETSHKRDTLCCKSTQHTHSSHQLILNTTSWIFWD